MSVNFYFTAVLKSRSENYFVLFPISSLAISALLGEHVQPCANLKIGNSGNVILKAEQFLEKNNFIQVVEENY